MRVPNLVPIGPQVATCIRPEGYTHRQTDTHTLSYIDIDDMATLGLLVAMFDFAEKNDVRPSRFSSILSMLFWTPFWS